MSQESVYSLANDIPFCSDMLECAALIDRFVALAKLEKDKRKALDKLYRCLTSFKMMLAPPLMFGPTKRYVILQGGSCTGLFLNRLLTGVGKPMQQLQELREAAEWLRSYFAPPSGKRVSEAFVKQVMEHLDARFGFTEKLVYPGERSMAILLFNNSSHNCNSNCHITTHEEKRYYQVDLYHIMPQTNIAPEYISFHELGHVVQAAFASSRSVPPSFLGLEINEYYRNAPVEEQIETFADAFAMAATYRNEFEQYAPRDREPEYVYPILADYFSRLFRGELEPLPVLGSRP